MPGLGQVDYTLTRPLTRPYDRQMEMERLGAMQGQSAAMQQQAQFAEEKQQMGRAEYERDLAQIRAVKQAVVENTLEDGNLNEDGFVRSLYSINPKMAMEAQKAFAAKNAKTTEASTDEIDRALEVIAGDANLGTESTTYKLLKAVRTNPKLAATVLGDASDINKAYSLISRDVSRENEMRVPKVQTAGATAAATTGARIKTESALSDVTASTEGKIAGVKKQSERDAGLTLSESAAERLGDFNASLSQLNTLSSQFKNPDAPQGPIAQLRKVNPYDWQAQAKQQLVAATKQMVGKALEGGVLRKEDEDKYNKILPTIGDTYESAVKKTENLVQMLGNGYNAKLTALKSAGYDVSKFGGNNATDDTDALIDSILQGK